MCQHLHQLAGITAWTGELFLSFFITLERDLTHGRIGAMGLHVSVLLFPFFSFLLCFKGWSATLTRLFRGCIAGFLDRRMHD